MLKKNLSLILLFLLMVLICQTSLKKNQNNTQQQKNPTNTTNHPTTKQSMKQNKQCPIMLLLSHTVSKNQKKTRPDQKVFYLRLSISFSDSSLDPKLFLISTSCTQEQRLQAKYSIIKRNLGIYHIRISTQNITDYEPRLSVVAEQHQPHLQVAYLRQFPESSSMNYEEVSLTIKHILYSTVISLSLSNH